MELLDHLVSAREWRGRDADAQGFRRLQINDEVELFGCSTGGSLGFAPPGTLSRSLRHADVIRRCPDHRTSDSQRPRTLGSQISTAYRSASQNWRVPFDGPQPSCQPSCNVRTDHTSGRLRREIAPAELVCMTASKTDSFAAVPKMPVICQRPSKRDLSDSAVALEHARVISA
jgi:hypothetical protein